MKGSDLAMAAMACIQYIKSGMSINGVKLGGTIAFKRLDPTAGLYLCRDPHQHGVESADGDFPISAKTDKLQWPK